MNKIAKSIFITSALSLAIVFGGLNATTENLISNYASKLVQTIWDNPNTEIENKINGTQIKQSKSVSDAIRRFSKISQKNPKKAKRQLKRDIEKKKGKGEKRDCEKYPKLHETIKNL